MHFIYYLTVCNPKIKHFISLLQILYIKFVILCNRICCTYPTLRIKFNFNIQNQNFR